MINKICANIDKNHIYNCTSKTIGRQGENLCMQLEITLEECLCDSWVYLHFKKADGTTKVTPKLEIIDNKVIYDIGNDLLDIEGSLKVFVELHKESGLVWRSSTKTYTVLNSFNGVDQIENKDDFITEAQKTLDNMEELKEEVETGLTPTIGDNENWFICGKDTGKPSRGLQGETYEITDEDYNVIENQVKTDIQPILEEIENISKQAEIIAKGRATGYVFDTLEDLDNWLLEEENVSKLVLGDNLYIRTVGVPDYWWDGTNKQVLETEKPDLTEYAKKEQFVTLTQAEYDALTEKSANTYYYIIEEE